MSGDSTQAHQHTLLICSVGGTPTPIVKSLLHWSPDRVLFVPSEETRSPVDAVLRAYAEAAGQPLSPGQYTIKPVPDAEDIIGSVKSIRALDAEITEWIKRDGGDYRVIVDFTGGTKCMSAALALVSRRWRCQYSYVGGARRTKNGVGVVESGSERVVHSANPWDALGYQAVEDAVTVFNRGGYAAAAALLDRAVRAADDKGVKRELSTLKLVIDAYAAWDCFDHKGAMKQFDDALKNRNDLKELFPHEAASLIARLEDHLERVKQLAAQNEPTTTWVEDLLHNAGRRAAEGRYDDAVARLYRAFEALAQVRLRELYGICNTKAVPLDKLPATLQAEWANRATNRAATVSERSTSNAPNKEPSDGPADVLMLGLQDAYRVLKKFGDELGEKFFDLGLAGQTRSPLVARNSSILAHGFKPIKQADYNVLYESACSIANFCEEQRGGWFFPATGHTTSPS